MHARAVIDLPQPDSPTRARVWPAGSVKLTPSTGRTGRAGAPSSTCRLSTLSSGGGVSISSRFIAMRAALPQIRASTASTGKNAVAPAVFQADSSCRLPFPVLKQGAEPGPKKTDRQGGPFRSRRGAGFLGRPAGLSGDDHLHRARGRGRFPRRWPCARSARSCRRSARCPPGGDCHQPPPCRRRCR